MRTTASSKTSLSDVTVEKLNQQIKLECASSQFYLSCASWLHKEGYQKASDFMYQHSEEERMHMLKLIRYVNDAGGHALAPEIGEIKTRFSSFREIFEDVLEHEIVVTRSINNLADHCFQAKDFGTFNFLQWYVAEQREEEQLARRVLELFDLIGEEGQGRWMIDREIGKLLAAEGAEGSEAGAE